MMLEKNKVSNSIIPNINISTEAKPRCQNLIFTKNKLLPVLNGTERLKHHQVTKPTSPLGQEILTAQKGHRPLTPKYDETSPRLWTVWQAESCLQLELLHYTHLPCTPASEDWLEPQDDTNFQTQTGGQSLSLLPSDLLPVSHC